jgi:hypothetical protein
LSGIFFCGADFLEPNALDCSISRSLDAQRRLYYTRPAIEDDQLEWIPACVSRWLRGRL